VTQNNINFIPNGEAQNHYYYPYTENINGTNYQVVKLVTVEVYNSTIDFNLAGTTNLSLMTPMLRSTVTKYFIYPIGTTFTGFTEGQPTTTTYTASNKLVTNVSLKASETIYLNSDIDNPEPAVLNFQITKKTITSLNASIQYRDGINDSSWENIGVSITDIEPYLGPYEGPNTFLTYGTGGYTIATYINPK
jgi:hypothetical protein